jgi:hypothetical protein
VNVSLLAIFRSSSFLEHVQEHIIANWEAIEGGRAAPPIEFVKLYDRRLDEWADKGLLSISSAFAIDRARLILREEVDGPT